MRSVRTLKHCITCPRPSWVLRASAWNQDPTFTLLLKSRFRVVDHLLNKWLFISVSNFHKHTMLTTVFLSLGCHGRHALPGLNSDFPPPVSFTETHNRRDSWAEKILQVRARTHGDSGSQILFLVFIVSQPSPREGGWRSRGGRHCISRGAVKSGASISHRKRVFQERRSKSAIPGPTGSDCSRQWHNFPAKRIQNVNRKDKDDEFSFR